MNDGDLYYLRSILGHLREVQSARAYGPSIQGEVLADNINWLDCFIDKYESAQRKQKQNFAAAMERSRAARAARKRLSAP